MKKLARRVGEHAQAHIDALAARPAETALSEGQANQINRAAGQKIKETDQENEEQEKRRQAA